VTPPKIRLPKPLASDPCAAELERRLVASALPLWSGGTHPVPRSPLGPRLVAALRRARMQGRMVRGLEAAEQTLAAEKRGLDQADARSGRTRPARVSRLLLVAEDGADRFYRRVETLLRRHGDRTLAVQVTADAAALGGCVYGEGRRARLLLLEHKEAVSEALLALATDPARDVAAG